MIKYKYNLITKEKMSLKMKQIIKNLLKISIFSLIFFWVFLFLNTFANSWEIRQIDTSPNNNANYKKIILKPIAQAWVAITTNIWYKLNKNSKINSSSIDNKIFSISDFYLNTDNVKNWLIKSNMLFIKEYYNIMNMNFAWVLKKSDNKQKTLFNLVKQLKIRLTNANSNLQTLYKQKSILQTEYEKINTQIETLKRNLETDFNKYEEKKVFTHVDNYYQLKQKQIILKTNIIFINNFIRKYNILNKYNSELVNVLSLNKDIISKKSYIVIPNSWTKILKDFNLIFSENEFKNKK